jgi:diaminopimelate decarboxylase
MGTIFDGFRYNDHVLSADGVSLRDVAEKWGTPTYVYVSKLIVQAYQELDDALAEIPHQICYAVKANSNIAIIKTLAQLGCGADLVSGGELFRALEAEVHPSKIVFSGVGKTREEIDYALKKRILCFNVESEQELVLIDTVAKSQKKIANICLRINPDVDPKTHPYIATGLKNSKFGIAYKEALNVVRQALRLKNVHLVGLGCHIGSQITQLSPFVDSIRRMMHLFDQVAELKCELQYFDVGGGLGITYQKERPPSLQSWAQALVHELKGRNLTLLLEPGRSIVGNAGVLITRVLTNKRGETNNYIIADAGMNDLIRPALYGSYHAILPVDYRRYKKIKAAVVGPNCESGDVLTKTRRIQNFQAGDLIAVMSAGAYGASMSSQYNSRPKAAEVLIRDGKAHTIRERETFEDLIAREKMPSFLKRASSIAL